MKTLDRQAIPFTVHVFREAGVYVAHAAELDVSSCGNTPDKAQENIKIAVRAFLQTADEHGTLEMILEEAGYTHDTNGWLAPEFVSMDHVSVEIH